MKEREKERDKDKDKDKDKDRDKDRDREREREKEKERDRDRDRARDKDRDRDRERERDKDKDRDRDGDRDRDKYKDRGREKEKTKGSSRDKSRERDKEKEKDWEKEKSKDRNREREREKDKERENDRDLEKEREKVKDKERERLRDREKEGERDRDRERERDKEKDRDRYRDRENGRERDRDSRRDRDGDRYRSRDLDRRSYRNRSRSRSSSRSRHHRSRRSRSRSKDRSPSKAVLNSVLPVPSFPGVLPTSPTLLTAMNLNMAQELAALQQHQQKQHQELLKRQIFAQYGLNPSTIPAATGSITPLSSPALAAAAAFAANPGNSSLLSVLGNSNLLSSISASTVSAAASAAAAATASAAAAAAEKKQRELYVGNLAIGVVTIDILKDLFNKTVQVISPDPNGLPPVIDARLDSSGRFGFVEFRTKDLADAAISLDKMNIYGRAINVGRPKGYQETSIPGSVNNTDVSNSLVHSLIPFQSNNGSSGSSSANVILGGMGGMIPSNVGAESDGNLGAFSNSLTSTGPAHAAPVASTAVEKGPNVTGVEGVNGQTPVCGETVPNKPTTVVLVQNMVTLGALFDDPDERNEILADASEEASKYGPLLGVTMPLPPRAPGKRRAEGAAEEGNEDHLKRGSNDVMW
eukprot:CAMPEP_0175053142 /NCGR_PEP_ID=MMETSP0052_2-20121109/8758_1 /TAXON_ID=51329 ORGANISM="Polytomella parva, Strain SAG 63-3" /NCGR_SAMPLE_ID=MMETSP0052_2 /ASSEMBLY_ACC=CAM_ASM_000194 /LENGTH=639 /DNA_ID=CAMNT_0016317639 /DNA_START=186 /DNA_END=2102 /DNA_ORIENTATION=+